MELLNVILMLVDIIDQPARKKLFEHVLINSFFFCLELVLQLSIYQAKYLSIQDNCFLLLI